MRLAVWYLALTIWMGILAAALILPAQGEVCLEENGNATGTGLHVMSIDLLGSNLTEEESQTVLLYHGYNVSFGGLVGINGTSWHVIRCNNTDMTELRREA